MRFFFLVCSSTESLSSEPIAAHFYTTDLDQTTRLPESSSSFVRRRNLLHQNPSPPIFIPPTWTRLPAQTQAPMTSISSPVLAVSPTHGVAIGSPRHPSSAGPPPSSATLSPEEEDNLGSVIASLKSSASAPFLDASKTSASHVTDAVRSNTVLESLASAQAAGARLAAAVRDEVVLQKEALLAEVDAVAALEKEVATVDAGVTSLAAASSGLTGALAVPYAPMARAVASLENIQAASDLLRRVVRFRACTKKLADASLFPSFSAAHKTKAEDLPGAAEAVRELDEMLGDTALAGVDSVAKFVPAVRKSAVELRKRVAATLKAGLAARDQMPVASAVLAFHALGVVADKVNAEVGRLLADTQSVVLRGLEAPRAGGGISLPGGFGATERAGSGKESDHERSGGSVVGSNSEAGTGGNRSEADQALSPGADSEWGVWSRMEAVLDTVRDSCFKAILLQQILSNKYDTLTHMSLLHEPIASEFIDAIAKALGEQMSVLARTHRQRMATGQVFRALAGDYPRLRALLTTLAGRVHSRARTLPHPITAFGMTRGPSARALPVIPDRPFVESLFISAAADVETHYLSASFERLTSAVSSVFERGRPAPGEAEALSITRVLAGELIGSRSNPELFANSVSNVTKILRIYLSNAEDFAASHTPSPRHQQSPIAVREWPLTHLHNGLVTLSTSARRVLGTGEDGAGPLPPSLAKEVDAMSAFADILLESPFTSCRARALRAVQNMHVEDLTGHTGTDDGCSIYAVDLTAQLSVFAEGVVLTLSRSRCLGQSTLSLAHHVLDIFVQHAVLVFPLPVRARQRLAIDMARVELAVESLCPVRMLGESYAAIRALRRIVFLTEEELFVADPPKELLDVLASLAPSAFAHHLFSRSKDDAFLHPHRSKNQSPAEYSLWLGAHSEEEAWEKVEAAVKSYEDSAPVTPCAEYKALKVLSPLLRKRWTENVTSSVW